MRTSSNYRCATYAAFAIGILFAARNAPAADWTMADVPLKTKWAARVSPTNALPEYPRPQMVRGDWTNLNGLWDVAFSPSEARPDPAEYRRKILVPFSIESALSGIREAVPAGQWLFYRRTFTKNRGLGQSILLHFGAVDWHAIVWVNGQRVGEHRGGYDAFEFDITDALHESGDQEIIVGVEDPTDAGTQPRGKQVRNPGGIFYTSVSGIWQTVWLEQTPAVHIKSMKISPNVDQETVAFDVDVADAGVNPDIEVEIVGARHGEDHVDLVSAHGKAAAGHAVVVYLPRPHLWSPDEPWLYTARVSLAGKRGVIDEVATYFAMRKFEAKNDSFGHPRIFLNGRPIFLWGTLDQGWWPDGLYTAPTDEALAFDVEMQKSLGFNFIRKHVKVEPARWYYHCDRLGMLVWQDMPSANLTDGAQAKLGIGPRDADGVRAGDSAAQFENELTALIYQHRDYPCIMTWVVFNEGWGQYDTERLVAWVKRQDPTRFVTGASGWTDRGVGDFCDEHIYPGPGMRPAEVNRVSVLGEFGGLGLAVPGHTWVAEKSWGYRKFDNFDALQARFTELVRTARPLISRGLSAAVYTQTTDVESEVNGLMTYDREVLKYRPEEMRQLSAELRKPPTPLTWVIPDGQISPSSWSYNWDEPQEGWTSIEFDDASWDRGRAPFGLKQKSRVDANTWLEENRVWLRRSFTLTELPKAAGLDVDYGGKTMVFINGIKVAEYDLRDERVYGEITLNDHLNAFRKGKNVVAVSFESERPERRRFDLGLYTY